jgi:hypothetical protein
MADDNKPTLLVVEECAETYHSVGRALAGGEPPLMTAPDGDEALDLMVAPKPLASSWVHPMRFKAPLCSRSSRASSRSIARVPPL